jgi:endonuclease I
LGRLEQREFAVRLAALLVLLLCAPALADYEAPNPVYDAPASYYSTATGTGTTLRTNLHNIVTAGFIGYSYGDSRFILDDLDRDPNNASNVILVYNRVSVSGEWDAGITWNREHLWPQSKLGVSVSNGYTGVGSDLFELKPCNPSINSGRSNDGYGLTTSTGPYQNTPTYFYPGDADKGDVSRALFYMATRYYNPAPGALPSPANL